MEREIIVFEDREEIAGIVHAYEQTDKWTVISNEITDQGRWTLQHEVILQRKSDGKFFITHYTVGATESQDHRSYEYDELVFYEVKPVKVETIKYVWREV